MWILNKFEVHGWPGPARLGPVNRPIAPRTPSASADANRWEMLFEQSPHSLQVFRPDGRSHRVNAAWRRLFGLTAEQALAFNILEDRQLARSGVADRLRAAFGGEIVQVPPIPYEVEVTGGREVRWIGALLFPVLDGDGRLLEVVCQHEDLTERRRQETTLRESRELLESITRNVSEAIYRSTPDGRLSFVNEAYLRLFGYASLADLNAIPRETLYATPEDRVRLLGLLQTQGGFRNEEVEFRRRDGTTFWGLIASSGHRDPRAGGIAWFDGVITDVTDRRRAEQAVRDLNASLEQRVAERTQELAFANEQLQSEIGERQRRETTLRAVWLISEAVHSARDLDQLYARVHEIVGGLMPSRNFYLLLRDRETGLDHTVYWADEVDPPPPPQRLRRGMNAYVLRTGRPLRATRDDMLRPLPLDLVEAQGEEWYLEAGMPSAVWLGVPLRLDGEVIGVMAVQDYEDETAYGNDAQQILTFVAEQTALAIQRKRAEGELIHALEREREVSQVRKDFVAMVSHEFRTPLGIIASSAGLLEKYFDRLGVEERREHLASIRGNTRRMSQLMEEVLLYGRVEEGRLACEPRPLRLEALCRVIVDELRSATHHRCPIRLQTGSLPEPLAADERLLRPILSNLLGNAVKYSPPGSPVDLEVEVADAQVRMVVRDHGCGIPAADLPLLFEPFRRGTNVGQVPGTGLGLAIVRRCVRLHQGTLDLASEAGVGTTVTVRLPLLPPVEPPSP